MFIQRIGVRGFRAAAEQQITCELPGRFSVIVGANGAGKTTLTEALYLGHRHVFPQIPRPIAAALSRTPDRAIEVQHSYEAPELHPYWSTQQLNGGTAPLLEWSLEPSMGRVRAARTGDTDSDDIDGLVLLYLRADRRPLDELAGREARLIVEALRAEQERQSDHRRLSAIRGTVGRLLDELRHDPLLQGLEQRVQSEVEHLAGAVHPHFPFVSRAIVDDDLLARILEFVLSTVDERALAQRLEISALGYVNLLHLAVILAAIPGSDPSVDLEDGDQEAEDHLTQPAEGGAATELEEAEQAIAAANEEADSSIDSLFPASPHVTIVIEEPEAHLHPQLQHGLTRHLRRVVARRPELQVVMTTHSSEVISGASVRDLVILRRTASGVISRCPTDLPMATSERDRVLRMADRHLDVTRSAALFAPYSVVVEGITDALLVRRFGQIWADGDERRQHFIDALTITIAGSRIGDWIPRLLATTGHELVERLAILGDRDRLGTPTWLEDFDDGTVGCFLSDPTLEPSLVEENLELVSAALTDIGASLDSVTRVAVAEYFGIGGTGHSKKAAFAEAIVDLLDAGEIEARAPAHIQDAITFVWDGFIAEDQPEGSAPSDATEPDDGTPSAE